MRFVQISDTHIFANKQDALLGVNTWESLQAIVALLLKYQDEFDFIIHTGDLSQDQTPASYNHIAECLNVFKKPIYFVPGNHDDPAVMEKVFPQGEWRLDKTIIRGNWQCVLLNSHQSHKVKGLINDEQLRFLENAIMKNPDKETVVFFHHHPLEIGCLWLDPLGVENSSLFWQSVKKFPQIKAIFFGHIHQEFAKEVNGIVCYGLPSTCIQFKPRCEHFELDKIPQGFRLTSLLPDGRIVTEVKRLAAYVGQFDANAKGY